MTIESCLKICLQHTSSVDFKTGPRETRKGTARRGGGSFKNWIDFIQNEAFLVALIAPYSQYFWWWRIIFIQTELLSFLLPRFPELRSSFKRVVHKIWRGKESALVNVMQTELFLWVGFWTELFLWVRLWRLIWRLTNARLRYIPTITSLEFDFDSHQKWIELLGHISRVMK